GNFSGEPMWNVTGVTGAAPVWIEIMNWLHRNAPSEPKTPPSGVVARKIVLAHSGGVRTEWFLKGTEPYLVGAFHQQAVPRILYPTAGMVIAQDPDIPAGQQRLFFEAYPRNTRLLWMLDGAEIGSAVGLKFWDPLPGKHTLSLLD